MDWTERILAFPVRTAAVDAFLAELKTKRSADLNAVLVTLNDGGLCREVVWYWISAGWIVVAPHSPLVAMAGPGFRPELTLRHFCGEPIEASAPEAAPAMGEGEEGFQEKGKDEEDAKE